MKNSHLLPITFGICCTPLNAMTQTDDYIYLECNLQSAVYDCSRIQETNTCDYSTYFQFTDFYRFSESKNDIGEWYVEYNDYQTLCKIMTCDIGKEVIYWGKSVDPDGYTSWSMQINRLTGAFSGDNRINANQPDGSMYNISGTCTQGESKISKFRKF